MNVSSPESRSGVPLVDLSIQTREVAEDFLAGVAKLLETGAFVLGPQVGEFESEFATYCGVEHCVGVANGTDALELALRGAGVGPGDEVIVPANTFVATAEAVVRAGATLVLVDCDEDFLIDPVAVRAALSDRTRAVVGVDLYGQVAPFAQIAEEVGPDVLLIEDAAQSQGATRQGQRAGGFGKAAATSFYPGKNLGAFGDAGAVLTNDLFVAERVRALRNHGGVRKYEHGVIGTNSRLDSIQAVALAAKLRRLDGWNAQRRAAADLYAELLGGVEKVTLPRVVEGNEHVWHLYVVRVPDRDAVVGRLHARGVDAGLHYPTPIHLLPAFGDLGLGVGSFPIAERLAGEIVSLPMFPGITEEQQRRVADALTRAARQ